MCVLWHFSKKAAKKVKCVNMSKRPKGADFVASNQWSLIYSDSLAGKFQSSDKTKVVDGLALDMKTRRLRSEDHGSISWVADVLAS